MEDQDRVLVAQCHFVVGELLKACWIQPDSECQSFLSYSYQLSTVQLHLWGRDEACVKLSAHFGISLEFRENAENLDQAIQHFTRALSSRPLSHPERAMTLCYLAHDLQARFHRRNDDADIDAAIEYYRAAARDPSAPVTPAFLKELVISLRLRFEQRRDPHDIDEAIVIMRQFLDAHPAPHLRRITYLGDLAFLLKLRLEDSSGRDDNSDIDTVINLRREAVALQGSTHPDGSTTLTELGAALRARFEIRRSTDDLEDAIQCHRDGLASSSSHSDRLRALTNLATAVKIRFETQGNVDDLDEIIQLWREEASLRTDVDRYGTLRDLGGVLEVRFDKRGNKDDLDEAIQHRREAVRLYAALDSTRSQLLRELSYSLRERFQRIVSAADLDEAVQLARAALVPCATEETGTYLRDLATNLQLRFAHLGHPHDIDEAIELYRKVLVHDPPTSLTLSNLSIAIQYRFDHQGNPDDIDEAVELCRKSLDLSPADHPKRSVLLINLGAALHSRFKQRASARDLDESVDLHRQALQFDAQSRSTFLSNLADVLQLRFQEFGLKSDIDEAIALYEEAIRTRTRHNQYRHVVLHNLAYALLRRSRKGAKDIDRAVQYFKETLDARAPPDPRRRNALNSLAVALVERFTQQHHTDDIEQAIRLSRESLDLCPDPDPNRSLYLLNVGNCILFGAKVSQSPADATEMGISKLREAAEYGFCAVGNRFTAAGQWIMAHILNHISALDAYRTRIHMLPEMASFSLNLNSRREVLTKGEITSLAASSATFAIQVHQPEVAVEFLEATRSVFWAQALSLRPPIEHLTNVRPELAANLNALSRQLELASFRDTLEASPTATQSQLISAEAETARCRKLAQDWQATIAEVRALPGFEDFLRPRGINSLRLATLRGPVVILLANESASSALILTSRDVVHLPLPAIKVPELEMQVQHLPRSTANESMTRLSAGRERFVQKSTEETLRIHLADLWVKLVKPVLEALKLEKSSVPPRLWWCPTGIFTFLPIHAAGIYDDKTGTDCVSDYVISSYTPTLTALLDRPPVPPETDTLKMSVIVEPHAPNCAPLPGTLTELSIISKRIPSSELTVIHSGTGEQVMQHLRQSSIVHFACHGVQDANNPLDSGLILSDGRLKVSRIMQRGAEDSLSSEGKGTGMLLAFLGACETARGEKGTPDEAMHLAATLLFAGFRGVVATMWTMDDRDGPKVADDFYAHLFKGSSSNVATADLGKAAEALHLAVANLRREPGISFSRWVPFVHYGL
ncbi:CHAT domain-containing protein [Roridomyces roridus]|uniref:CHAT domain-containing protein n=1 Tax=Roridomyces roridus TaxID=1738132 RepID=A0AAD7BQ19_9AGAR|nr:CHAT domain-containing protein [Roridomyces roridus]